ncbi:MAG: glycosyltransferase family 4 protein, partial [Anaerolineae bacterium]|nr:glycosyltransferase family 4 protein [Anaerolineae bacterium]
KNPVGVVRILAAIKDLEWRAVMVGDGPLRPAIEEAIQAAGLSERIQLTGWIQPQEVINHYRQSDIMLLPSLSEGLPVVGVQGMAMGLSLVLSKAGGNVDLVQPGENGVLLDIGAEDEFATALRDLLSDPQKLLAQRLNSRRLAARFDLDKIVEDYENLFKRAASSR